MSKWQPVDYVVAGLATVIGGILIAAAIVPLLTGTALSEPKAKMMAGLIGSCIAIVNIWVGAKIQENRKNGDDKKK